MDFVCKTLSSYIDFTEYRFFEAVAYSFLCFLGWVILPHLEFKYKLLSRLTNGNQGMANDFLTYFLIYTGCMRNFAFNEAMNNNKHIEYGVWQPLAILLGYAMVLIGGGLVTLSFYRLGLRGMYFGDHFGFLFKEKITAFPYNYIDNPQYVGTTILFSGASIAHGSAAGLFITLLVNVLYKILFIVESRKLSIFYPPEITTNTQKAKAN